MKKMFTLGAVILFGCLSCAYLQGNENENENQPKPKNVIIFLGDGMGYPCYDKLKLPKKNKNTVELSVQTCCLTGGTDAYYDEEKTKQDPKRRYKLPTDSAAAGSALGSGEKIQKGKLNTRPDGSKLVSVAAKLKAKNKRIGIVTSVPLPHATPAGFGGAHNQSRENYAQIANEMLSDTIIDVFIGCGHPFYTDNGQYKEKTTNDYKYVGGKETWDALLAGTHSGQWTLYAFAPNLKTARAQLNGSELVPVKSKAKMKVFRQKRLTERTLIVAPVRETLQFKRDKKTPALPHMPKLSDFTAFSLEQLSGNKDGFYLMVEGGAIDYANHANDYERMIEELTDYNNAILLTYKLLDENTKKKVSPNWDDTLVIITADHETGGIDVQKNGSLKYTSDYHTNVPVPLRADGAGSHYFETLEKLPFGGIDNTQIPNAILELTK